MKKECKIQLKKFSESIKRLAEVLSRNLQDDDIILDATIQRFEFTYENGWKAIKRVLKYKGDDCLSPRDCIKKAYKYGWIDKEDVFLELLDCRNMTSHTYNMKIAMKVYKIIKNMKGPFRNYMINWRKRWVSQSILRGRKSDYVLKVPPGFAL